MRPGPGIEAAIRSTLALLAGLACTAWGGGWAGGAPPQTAERGTGKMRVVTTEKAVGVVRGERIDLVVTRPVAIPPDLQYAWPAAPSIAGEAVRFVRVTVDQPPPDVDGGVTTHHYELEAVAPGKAVVTLVARPASSRSARPPVVVEVTVRAGEAASLAEVVRALADVVSTSGETPVEVARRFGEVESDSQGGVYVRPADPRLRQVIVVKRHGTGDLGDVELRLTVPGSLAVSELEALWGAPGRPPALAIVTRTLVFRPSPPAGARFRATVALTVEGDESGPVTWVKVIRDVP